MMVDGVKNRPATVLYVEDEESDVFFMREAFRRAAPGVQLRTVGDGQQAVDYLAGQNGYTERAQHPLPSLVLLDLNLPAVSGFEVLKWMRQQPQFRTLPVVVFSSSANGQDKWGSDELGADWYLEKPVSAKGFCDIVEQARQRWLSGSGVAGAEVSGPTNRMRKLVQHKATKAFLTENGDWTADWRSARVFATTEAARAAVLAHRVTNVELYYLFEAEPSKYDFTISVLL